MLQPDPGYYARYNTKLLECMTADAATVLEIGCGQGELARQYKRSNPRCRYFGVEANQDAAAGARKHLDVVVTADVQTLERADIPGLVQPVDCLVYGDVLEHLADPWATLERHREWLAPNGQVLACVPNVQYWEVLRDLLRGKWEYQAQGVLDATHLRFFTLHSLVDMFKKTGFEVLDVLPLYFEADADAARPFLHALTPAAAHCGVDPATLERQALAKQYVLRATRTRPPRLALKMPASPGPAYHRRIFAPLRCFFSLPGVRVTDLLPNLPAPVGEDKVYVHDGQALCGASGLETLRTLLRANTCIVADCHEDPFEAPAQQESRYLALRGAHAVQVSSATLAERVRKLNPNLAVFPDQLERIDPFDPPDMAPDTPVRVFLPAAPGPERWDWGALLPCLKGCHARRVMFVVACDESGENALCDADLLARLGPDATRVATTDLAYAAVARSCHLALLPPAQHSGEAWSELPLLECGAHGLACLAAARTWGRSLVHGQNGLLFEDAAGCREQLDALLADATLRRGLAAAAYAAVRDRRMLALHIRTRYNWYRRLIQSLPELTRDLKRRVPELFAG